MGRTVYAEERLHNYLISLIRPDEYTIGLIVGQVRFLYVSIYVIFPVFIHFNNIFNNIIFIFLGYFILFIFFLKLIC